MEGSTAENEWDEFLRSLVFKYGHRDGTPIPLSEGDKEKED